MAKRLSMRIDGRPHFAKRSIDDGEEGGDCSHRSGLFVRGCKPLSLMEYAGWILSKIARSNRRFAHVRFFQPRSDLSRHHVMIACAILGSFSFRSRSLIKVMQGYPWRRALAVPL